MDISLIQLKKVHGYLMYEDLPIKPYPGFFRYLPISDSGFNAIFNKTIYLSKELYIDIQTTNPKPLSVAVLKHQIVHANNACLLKFLKYIASKKFRLIEEGEAFTAMFKHLKVNNKTFDLEKVAKNFSGIRYLWMTTYTDGLRIVNNFWEKA